MKKQRRLFAYLGDDLTVATFGKHEEEKLRRVSLKNLTLVDWLPPSTISKTPVTSALFQLHKTEDLSRRESRKEKRITFSKLHSKQENKEILLPLESPYVIVANATLESVQQVILDTIKHSADVADIVIICSEFIQGYDSPGDPDDRVYVSPTIKILLWRI